MATELTREELLDGYKFYRELKTPEGDDKALELGRRLDALPVAYDPMASVKNLPSSLYKAGSDMVGAAMNPIDTTMAAGNLVLSGGANAVQMGLDAAGVDYQVPNQEAGADFAGMLDDRYGSMDALKTTAMEDPAGLLLDTSGLLTGGGSAVAKAGGKAGKVGEVMQTAGNAIDPLTAGPKVAGYFADPISRSLYNSAMKPIPSLNNPVDRAKLIEDGIELAALPTEGSLKRLEKKKRKLGKEIDGVLAEADKLGGVSDYPELIVDPIQKVKNQYPPHVLSHAEAMDVIDAVVTKAGDAMGRTEARPLTVREINDIKKDLDASIRYNLKSRVTDSATTRRDIEEAVETVVANKGREILYRHAPDLEDLNRQYGQILNVEQNMLFQSKARVDNHNPIGLLQTTGPAAGAALGGPKGAAAAAALATLSRATPSAMLGIGMDRFGKQVRKPNNPFKSAALAGRYESAVLANEQERERERQMREANK